MPVIVRELVIKAVVSGDSNDPGRHQKKQKKASQKGVEAGLKEVIKLIQEKNER